MFEDWTTDELEEHEANISAEIQALDAQIAALRTQMREKAGEVEPVRVELQRRRKERADSDPRTQTIGGL